MSSEPHSRQRSHRVRVTVSLRTRPDTTPKVKRLLRWLTGKRIAPRLWGTAIIRSVVVDEARQCEGHCVLFLNRVDMHAKGFTVHGHIMLQNRADAFPEITFSATDNDGRKYPPCGGYTAGGGDRFRFVRSFAPALRPGIAALCLELIARPYLLDEFEGAIIPSFHGPVFTVPL